MLVLISAVIVAFCQSFLNKYIYYVPYMVYIMFIGIIWGVLLYHFPNLIEQTQLLQLDPCDAFVIYTPPIIFKMAFCLDVYTFLTALPQILIIALPVGIVTGLLTGIVSLYLIDTNWPIVVGIHFGFLCIPTYVTHVTKRLKQLTTGTIHTRNLLEGESLLAVVCTLVTNNALQDYRRVETINWSYFVIVTIRYVLLGVMVGYVYALIVQFLVRRMEQKSPSITMLLIVFPFFVYFTSGLCKGSGTIASTIFGILMAIERTTFSKEIEDRLLILWNSFAATAEMIISLHVISKLALQVLHDILLKDWFLVVVVYLVFYICRFISFLLFSPLLSRIGAGITFKNMLLCVWGGTKSPLTLTIMENSMYWPPNVYEKFLFYLTGVYFLSYLINGMFVAQMFKVLGFIDISLARQVNMNNCIKHIFKKRASAIGVLKTKRFFSDADWSLVANATCMNNPYSTKTTEEEDDGLMGYKYAYCEDCQLDVLQKPTPKQWKEMIKEAKLRILKAKKMSYSRQYENEMMSDVSIRILIHAVDTAMETEEAEIILDGLHNRFQEESYLHRFLRRALEKCQPETKSAVRPPRHFWRRKCYHLIKSRKCHYFMYIVVLMNMVSIGLNMWPIIYHSHKQSEQLNFIISLTCTVFDYTVCLIYFMEFFMKIMAYSRIYIFKHGFGSYFKSKWNIVDFIVLCLSIVAIYLHSRILQNHDFIHKHLIFIITIEVLRTLCLVRILRHCTELQPKMLRYLEARIDTRKAFTYELGRSYIAGEEEVLEMLPFMIDHKDIREQMQQKLENDRTGIIKLLGLVQKEKPWIAVTVKTKQAIRAVLSQKRNAIRELRVLGWIDEFETYNLTKTLNALYRNLSLIESVKPSAPKVIFREVDWMCGDQDVIDFLFENVTVKKFQPGDVVFQEGDVAEGIYIVVTGLLMISYVPQESVLESLRQFGELPVADYIPSHRFKTNAIEYIVSGNCVGELSTLTRRPYNCRIVADAHTQVYVLSHGIIKRAMELNSDPLRGLESRIWKSVAARIALPILLTIPAYQASPNQAKLALERSFILNLGRVETFVINETIEDIILIEGVGADLFTRETFVAPCYIPRTVQSLILPSNELMNIPINIETKLLIIPEQLVDDYEVMLVGTSTCELMAMTSEVKCIQHLIQDRIAQKQRKHRRPRKKNGRYDNEYRSDRTSNTDDSAHTKSSTSLNVYLHKSDEYPQYPSISIVSDFEKK